jgi:signal transduction histidine kinase
MSQQSTRSAVPPRELAATITARAVLRAGWAVAMVYLVIAFVAIVELWIVRGYPAGILASLVALVLVSFALAAVIRKPGRARGLAFLAVGAVAAIVYDLGLLVTDPALNEQGMYLVNRITIVLLLLGAVSTRLIDGVLWCAAGFLLGTGATAIVQAGLGLAVRPGYGPVVSLTVYVAIIVMFVLIRRSQRRFAPDFSAIEVETARMAGQRELEAQAVALLHDTVLNDLAAVASGRDTLDERARARLLRDIAAVSSAQVGQPASGRAPGEAVAAAVRQELLSVISDFQWRGLTVDVSGGDALLAQVSPEAADALVGAVGGCLENIVRHSGSDVAEVFLDATEESLSVMIVDHGRGFDPETIPANRLGIRRALVDRITGCGGTVRLWSAIGAGTSVVITVPLAVPHD